MKREGGGDRSKGEGGERTCQGKKDSVLRALTKNPRKEMAVPHRHDSASSPSASTSRPPLACISSALLLVIWGGREGGGGVSLQLTRRQNRFQATKTRPPAGSLACLPPACPLQMSGPDPVPPITLHETCEYGTHIQDL